MEESKETATKRPLELSLPWIRTRKDAEAEAGMEGEAGADYLNPIPKRPCTGGDGDSFEEFFAVLQRIEATHKYSLTTRNHLNRQEAAVKCSQDVKIQASKAAWLPSFEWEDFSSRGNGIRDVKSSLSAVKAGDGRVEEKDAVRHGVNNTKPEASPNPDLEGLDLNNLPAGLPLFQ